MKNSPQKKEKSSWFRLWTSTLHSRKIQELSPEIFKFWINFLCASRLNNGCVSEEDLTFLTRSHPNKTKKAIKLLIEKNLATEEDGYFFPHDWEAWQFDSDNSTERVKKHREKIKKREDGRSGNSNETFQMYQEERSMQQKGNVSETSPETETDTDTEKEPPIVPHPKITPTPRKKDPGQRYAPEFEIFWKFYPRKVGKEAAYKAWGKLKPPLEACLSTLDWQTKSRNWLKDDGEYIPHPSTWLNQMRWEDEKIIDPLESWAMEG